MESYPLNLTKKVILIDYLLGSRLPACINKKPSKMEEMIMLNFINQLPKGTKKFLLNRGLIVYYTNPYRNLVNLIV